MLYFLTQSALRGVEHFSKLTVVLTVKPLKMDENSRTSLNNKNGQNQRKRAEKGEERHQSGGAEREKSPKKKGRRFVACALFYVSCVDKFTQSSEHDRYAERGQRQATTWCTSRLLSSCPSNQILIVLGLLMIVCSVYMNIQVNVAICQV